MRLRLAAGAVFFGLMLAACNGASTSGVAPTASPPVAASTVVGTATGTPVAGAVAPMDAPQTRPDPVYAFPVDPASAADFDAEVNGHGYPATDIFAAEGTAVVSVTAGVVAFVNRVDTWSDPPDDGATRGGLYLTVHGDDGLQYYFSHLAEVRADLVAGGRVEAGELLGYVGRTGSARRTPPHLHFGISCPTDPADWERRRGEFDPIPYLVAWEAGDDSASPAEAYAVDCEQGRGR